MAQIVGMFAAVALGLVVLATAFGDVLPTWTLAVTVPAWMGSIVLARRRSRTDRDHAVERLGLAPTDRVRPAPPVLAGYDVVPMWDGTDALAQPGDPPIIVLHGRERDARWNGYEEAHVHHDVLIALTAGVKASWTVTGTASQIQADADRLPDGAWSALRPLSDAGNDAEVAVRSGWLAVVIPWPLREGPAIERLVMTTRSIIANARPVTAS
jgi:hypothetical protein